MTAALMVVFLCLPRAETLEKFKAIEGGNAKETPEAGTAPANAAQA